MRSAAAEKIKPVPQPAKRRRVNASVEPMTAAEFAAARAALGLTLDELADVTGLSSRRSVWAYEKGPNKIPGPMMVLMRAFLDGYRPANWPSHKK